VKRWNVGIGSGRILAGWIAAVVLLGHSGLLWAQMGGMMEPAGNPRLSLAAAPAYQFKSNVTGGGDLSIARFYMAARTGVPIAERWRVSAGLTYEFEDYHFSQLSGFAVSNPWNKVDRVGLSAGLGYRVSEQWNVFASPIVQYAGERGAEFGESLMYGGVAGATYRVNPDLLIGAGAGVFYRFEETRFFPSLLLSWKITDRLRLGNSYRIGLAGPAGLELDYALTKDWTVGVGGGYRSHRFRLDQKGPVPGGIGENDAWPFYARLGWKLARGLNLDFYAGAAFGGKLKLEDRAGNSISSASYDTAPLAGFTFSARF
jgi:hypothetical protein